MAAENLATMSTVSRRCQMLQELLYPCYSVASAARTHSYTDTLHTELLNSMKAARAQLSANSNVANVLQRQPEHRHFVCENLR